MRTLSDLVGDDPFASYDRAARAGLDVWSAPGALERTYTLPMGERTGAEALCIHQADLLLHGWDLAEATHQDATLDPALARFALETEQWFVQPAMRGPAPRVRGRAVCRWGQRRGAPAGLRRPHLALAVAERGSPRSGDVTAG